MHHRHIAYKSLLNTEGNLGFKRAELSLDKQVLFSFQLGSIRFHFFQFPSEFGEAQPKTNELKKFFDLSQF